MGFVTGKAFLHELYCFIEKCIRELGTKYLKLKDRFFQMCHFEKPL
jgi:hypothetical protein